jgi:hypothetical protein
MMSLESIEERSIHFLGQAQNPLVPVDTLLRHLWQEEEFAGLTRVDLVSFLGKHELVMIIDPELEGDPHEAAELREAGVATGPRVILKTRMPSKAEMSDQIKGQLTTMTDALAKALEEAEEAGDADACVKIKEILERAEQLRDELGKVL